MIDTAVLIGGGKKEKNLKASKITAIVGDFEMFCFPKVDE